MTKNELIEKIIDQIVTDNENGDDTVTTELLDMLSYKQLQEATDEDDWEDETK